MLTESQQVRTLLGEDVTYLMPAAARPARTPEDREAARQRVMRHVTECVALPCDTDLLARGSQRWYMHSLCHSGWWRL